MRNAQAVNKNINKCVICNSTERKRKGKKLNINIHFF